MLLLVPVLLRYLRLGAGPAASPSWVTVQGTARVETREEGKGRVVVGVK